MLNEKRYIEVKNVFAEHGVELTESDIRLYADVFEIIAHYVNDKLTTREIMEAYDFLSDVILNRRPDIKVHVEKSEKIKLQVALMDKIPFIGNKLDLEEKTTFAFCIYLGECVRIYDEENDTMTNGIVLFKSVESIGQEFENYKSINPTMFGCVIDNTANESRKDFGYSKSNPVLTKTIGEAYNYLSRLVYEGGSITYTRIGSVSGGNGYILDMYKITVTKSILFFRKSMDYTIYIDSYANSTSTKAPKPFILK
ncbi:MAG: hypothetical protein II997_05515 [Clostridia bacterium]|nr:hypothetical protein [Clostridia bacterium]